MKFLDTNILVYAMDFSDKKKHEIAAKIIDEAVAGRGFAVSAQVLFEFSNVCLKNLAYPEGDVLKLLSLLRRVRTVPQTSALVARAVELRAIYGISLQDSMIVAAAETAGAEELLTEDLNDGQFYAGVRAVNPFK